MDTLDALIPPIQPVPSIKGATKGAKKRVGRRHEKSTEELYGEHMPKDADEAMRSIWQKPARGRADV